MITKRFYIGGMTCINCQNKIENKLQAMNGVKDVRVSYKTGEAQIEFDTDKISFARIEQTVKKLGYEVMNERKAGKYDVIKALCFLGIIIILYIVLDEFGILNLLVPSRLADSGMGYGMLFVVGLLTSVHCIAMCGGINLSQCLPTGEAEECNKKGMAFLPAIFYNLGRVVSYTVIGFLLGLVGWLIGGGSSIGISTVLQGIVKIIAGVLMVVMGINMLGIFPWLRRFNPRMPNFFAKKIGAKKSKVTQPLVVGLLNGLMPCGPLQSMQILALASANPFVGALSMLLFSLGTVPLMLGFGSLVSALGKRFTRVVMNIGAVLVTVLGFAMLAQGGSLSGWLSSELLLFIIIGFSVVGIASVLPFTKKAYQIASVVISFAIVITSGVIWQYSRREKPQTYNETQIVDGVQIVNSTLSSGKYPTITVQEDIPVKWIINAPSGSINGCNYKVLIQEYNIEYTFQSGENIIEFTPTEVGVYSYTCWMGMIEGKIIVTEKTDSSPVSSTTDTEQSEDNSETLDDAEIISEGEYLSIPILDITEEVTFYSFTVDGVAMEVLAIRASDGTVRTAFNTCQMCYTSGNGYYIQNGKYLTCQNCGSRFTADQVEHLSGGCNPWPISAEDKIVVEDTIRISYDFLKEFCDIFEYMKK